MYITTGAFQRSKNSKWESCIILETSKPYKLIISNDGTIVKKLYDFKTLDKDLLIYIKPILEDIDNRLND